MTEETEKIITEDTNRIHLLNTLREEPKKEIDNANSLKRPILHTMKSDMQEYIDQKKMSIVEIAGKQAQKQGIKISTTYTNWPNKLITLAVIMLVIISAGILSYTIIRKKTSREITETPEKNLPEAIVLPNEQKIITLLLDKQEANKNIITEITQTDTLIGNLTNFIFTDENKKVLTSGQFLESIGVNAPFGFSAFLTDQFMFGTYSFERNESFIILKVRSYENIFALMLKWEKTMKNDLSVLLPSTDTSTDSIFQDRIIKNHDTRILYSQNGQINILYSFLDKETVLITSSVNTFEEILRRLSSPKL